jgi:hypothetical protein
MYWWLMRGLAISLMFALACGGSSGKPADAACTGGSGCAQPCDEGNNLGVGRYCTKNGGQCGSNNNAFVFCTVDVDPTAEAFCTGPCGSDAECGQNAFCDGSGGAQRGCVPASCGGSPMGSGSAETP